MAKFIKLNYLIFNIIVWCLAVLILKSECAKCPRKTPCMSLRECRPIMQYIESAQKPLKPTVVNFLRSRQCGFANGQPKVCCGQIPTGVRTLKTFQRTRPKTADRQTYEKIVATSNSGTLNAAKSTGVSRKRVMRKLFPARRVLKANITEARTPPPSFKITVVTAPPDATAVPYLAKIRRKVAMYLSNNQNEMLPPYDAYLSNYDLQRNRRDSNGSGPDVDVEFR